MLGYGIGYIGQGSTYNFMGTYFVVFLTNCAGLSSTLASTIASVGLFAEVIAGMIVGNLSDNCTSPMGKRRPFILTAAIVMPVIMVLIMRTIHASIPVMFVYYLTLSICFRLIFSTFEIPNNAFGAEIARGYDERTRLRTSSRVFSIIGNALGYVMPLWILELFSHDQEAGWQTIGIIIAFGCLFSWIASFVLTKKRSVIGEKHDKKGNVFKDIFVNYFQLCKLRTMRLLIVYKAAFACAFAVFNIGTIYYLKYSLGLDNRYSSYIYILTIIIFILMTPLANKMALSLGKANQQMITMAFSAAIGYLVFLFAPRSVIGAAIYVMGFAVMQTSFWQLSSSIFYDIVEVDEYVHYKRREGDIMSLVSVLGTLITAVIVQLFGIFFDRSGFDPALEVQPASAIAFLNAAYILVPSICFTVGFAALKVFPINKKTFGSLVAALKLRREGGDFSMYMDDIRKLL